MALALFPENADGLLSSFRFEYRIIVTYVMVVLTWKFIIRGTFIEVTS